MNDQTPPEPQPDFVVQLNWYYDGESHPQGSEEFKAVAEPFVADGMSVSDDGSSRYPVGRGAGGGIDAGQLIAVISVTSMAVGILANGPRALQTLSTLGRPIGSLVKLLGKRRREQGKLPGLLLSVDLDNVPEYGIRPQHGRHLLLTFPPTDDNEAMEETIAAISRLPDVLLPMLPKIRQFSAWTVLWNRDEKCWYLKVPKDVPITIMFPALLASRTRPSWNGAERSWYLRLPER